jgi:hypothetical protein
MESKEQRSALEHCRERFEGRRRRRTTGRIPAELWSEALGLAEALGVPLVARTLQLDEQALRERMRRSSPRPGRHSSSPGFVEVPLGIGPGPRYVIDLEVAGQVRLRVEVHGDTTLDVESLARSVVGGCACSR